MEDVPVTGPNAFLAHIAEGQLPIGRQQIAQEGDRHEIKQRRRRGGTGLAQSGGGHGRSFRHSGTESLTLIFNNFH